MKRMMNQEVRKIELSQSITEKLLGLKTSRTASNTWNFSRWSTHGLENKRPHGSPPGTARHRVCQ